MAKPLITMAPWASSACAGESGGKAYFASGGSTYSQMTKLPMRSTTPIIANTGSPVCRRSSRKRTPCQQAKEAREDAWLPPHDRSTLPPYKGRHFPAWGNSVPCYLRRPTRGWSVLLAAALGVRPPFHGLKRDRFFPSSPLDHPPE